MSDIMLEYPVAVSKNEVSCADNIVRYTICASVNNDEAMSLSTIGKRYLEGGQAQYVIIDLRRYMDFSASARKILVEFLQNDKIKKTAFFGGNVFVKTLAAFVIAAAGKKNVKFFDTEENALAWFKE